MSWIEITSIANKSSNIIINYHFSNQNICFNFPKLFKIRVMNMRANFYKAFLSYFNLKSVRPDNNQLLHFLYFPAVLHTHKCDSAKILTSRNVSQLYLEEETGIILRFSVFLSIKRYPVVVVVTKAIRESLHRVNETPPIYLRRRNTLQRQHLSRRIALSAVRISLDSVFTLIFNSRQSY